MDYVLYNYNSKYQWSEDDNRIYISLMNLHTMHVFLMDFNCNARKLQVSEATLRCSKDMSDK